VVVKRRKATVKDAKQLHEMMLIGLKDKTSQIYKANIDRLGIPEEYVRQAFSIEALTNSIKDTSQLFLVATQNHKLIGFAQAIRQNEGMAELDRIFLIPEETGKGTGTQLLNKIIDMLRREDFDKLTVRTGKDETLAREFYEKNGFKLVGETSVKAPWGRLFDLAIYELKIKK
jgi:N-acetylglutamate synthase-like GNAT family acetyltransferase